MHILKTVNSAVDNTLQTWAHLTFPPPAKILSSDPVLIDFTLNCLGMLSAYLGRCNELYDPIYIALLGPTAGFSWYYKCMFEV